MSPAAQLARSAEDLPFCSMFIYLFGTSALCLTSIRMLGPVKKIMKILNLRFVKWFPIKKEMHFVFFLK